MNQQQFNRNGSNPSHLNMSKSPTVFQQSQASPFIYNKQMANNNGAVTSPRLTSQDTSSMGFIPNQRGSPTQYMGYSSMQGHPNGTQQQFMMQPQQFAFNPSYAHMGLSQPQFNQNLSTLLQGQSSQQNPSGNFQFYSSMSFQPH
jgi:hypothetical protein